MLIRWRSEFCKTCRGSSDTAGVDVLCMAVQVGSRPPVSSPASVKSYLLNYRRSPDRTSPMWVGLEHLNLVRVTVWWLWKLCRVREVSLCSNSLFLSAPLQLTGVLDDCFCDVESIDVFNNFKIYPRIKKLTEKDYFRYYRVRAAASPWIGLTALTHE